MEQFDGRVVEVTQEVATLPWAGRKRGAQVVGPSIKRRSCAALVDAPCCSLRVGMNLASDPNPQGQHREAGCSEERTRIVTFGHDDGEPLTTISMLVEVQVWRMSETPDYAMVFINVVDFYDSSRIDCRGLHAAAKESAFTLSSLRTKTMRISLFCANVGDD